MNQSTAQSYALMVAKSIVADHTISDNELRRVYEVMAALNLHEHGRIEVLNYLFLKFDDLKVLPIPEEILSDQDVRLSLAKDTVFIREQAQNDETYQMAAQVLAALGITGDQMKFFKEWAAWENQALRRLGAGEIDLANPDNIKELASRAASVGIPLSALYMAGTVGFGAVGITSGLASIGLGSGLTLLGLNPMTAGIAALIVAGISIKKIADFAFANDKKAETQDALLEGKKLHARFRRFLVDDIARYDSEDVVALFAGHEAKHVTARGQMNRLLRENVSLDTQ